MGIRELFAAAPGYVLTRLAPSSSERPAEKSARTAFRGGWSLLPWSVSLIGIPVSVLFFVVLQDSVEDVARHRFERQTSEAKGLIELRINFYADILYGLRALFSTQHPVSRLAFHRYVASLELQQRYPGFDLVNFAAYIPHEERERFEASVRSDRSLEPKGYPAFAIKPAGQRDEYHVIVYLEPMRDFEFAFGLDLGANPALAATPERLVSLQHVARDTGKLTASGLPIRVKGAREYVGLAMRLAVYHASLPVETVEQRRAAYLGSVGAGFNVQNLMKGALDEDMARYMRFKLYDIGSASDPVPAALPASARLLFDSAAARDAPKDADRPDGVFTRSVPIEVGGRLWRVDFSAAKDDIIETVDALSPWIVLMGGVLTSLLLTGLFASLSSSHRRAVAIAQDMTKHLRESETSLAEAHALLSDAQKLAGVGCCQYTPVTERMIWSEELYRIHGVDPATFMPTYANVMDLVHPEDRAEWEGVLLNTLSKGEPFTAEFRIVRPDGAVRHVRSLGEVMNDLSGRPLEVLWSVLDITDQKQTEHALRSSAEQLTALSRRLVEIQETERRQLSRELHDRVGQNLTALSINLDILGSTLLDERHADQRARLNDSSVLLESTVDSIENVMAELRPPMLDDYGLLPALHWYAKDFSKRTGIEVIVTGDESAERAAPDMEIALFRIAQEALTNVTKHAGATRVEIVLRHTGKRCELTITDNGIGLGPAKRVAGHRHGLGMVTMRERSQAVGGRFSVRTVDGGGTRVAISIP